MTAALLLVSLGAGCALAPQPCTPRTWYVDADVDGHGTDEAPAAERCEPPGERWAATAGDCDDRDASRHPGASETCDAVDQDCDGVVDEDAVDAPAWYADTDGDGAGDPAGLVLSCQPPEGYVDRSGDCDDTSPGVHIGAVEVCDGIDNDCDLRVDEGLMAPTLWVWGDGDADGWGDSAAPVADCDGVPDDPFHAAVDGDCDDDDPTVHPGAKELGLDGVDQDCDGLDLDADGDGVDPAGGFGPVDCDDADAGVSPGHPEVVGTGVDDDCDGVTDEGTGALGELAWSGLLARDAVTAGLALARGDLDGDGLDELLYSGEDAEPSASTDGGPGWVVGWSPTQARLDEVQAVPLRYTGGTEPDSYGTGLALLRGPGGAVRLAIVDAGYDGFDGAVFFVDPAVEPAGHLPEVAWGMVPGGHPREGLGPAGGPVGDLDGDGWDDVVVATHGGRGGTVRLLSSGGEGSTPLELATIGEIYAPGELYAISTALQDAPVDVDQDGLADVVLTSAHPPGLLVARGPELLSGPVEADLFVALEPEVSHATLPLTIVADPDGAGYPGVLVASPEAPPGDPSTGTAWLFGGPLDRLTSPRDALARIDATAHDRYLGTLLAAADLDGDGHLDVVLGEGPRGGSTTLATLYGPLEGVHSSLDAAWAEVGAEDERITAITTWQEPDRTHLVVALDPLAGTADAPARPGRLLVLP